MKSEGIVELVLEIESCGYKCEAGPLSRNLAFMKLKELAACAQQNAAPEVGHSPCALCGCGGKHLEAPPCCTCPAYPKEAEKNEPLTIDELRQMDGEPVFLEDLVHKYDPKIPNLWGGWIVFAKHNQAGFTPRGGGFFDIRGYGETWLAYRHKTKEGTT